MNRELLEESHKRNTYITNFISETKVIGYFRWLEKGGTPEFIGITTLNVNHNELTPNISEVDNPEYLDTVYPAENIKVLKKINKQTSYRE